MKDLVSALKRKASAPRPQAPDPSREAALARMESSANPEAAAPAEPKKKKSDPAANFLVSIFWMVAFMGISIGVDQDEPAAVIIAVAAFFVGVFLSIKFGVAPKFGKTKRTSGLSSSAWGRSRRGGR